MPNQSGWNRGDVTVTLKATDRSGAGIREITYSASGAQPIQTTTVNGDSASITISAQGQTILTFSARDNAGNVEAQKTVLVRIDKTAPTLSCRAIPNLLWPPNHQMVVITVTIDVSDSISGLDGFQLMSVVSNEPDNGLGDGDQPNDIQGWKVGSPSLTGQLRAERSGKGTGRIYTLTYKATDQAGTIQPAWRLSSSPVTKGNSFMIFSDRFRFNPMTPSSAMRMFLRSLFFSR